MTQKRKTQVNATEEKILDNLTDLNMKSMPEIEKVFKNLKTKLLNKMLSGELDYHLGYEKHSKCDKEDSNRRNGNYPKKVITEEGRKLDILIPRDRQGSYEPYVIKKGENKIRGFDDRVISLYARGMSMREIQGHLHEIYDMEISPELISQITNSVIEEVRQWQNRPLDDTYPIVYMDCIQLNMKNEACIIKKHAVYLALGVNMEGKKEILGMWISENEGAKFWMKVITEIKNRGVENILVAAVDGLKGFPEAINAIYPKTLVQCCIVHMVRNSTKYVSYKDLREVTKDLKAIYNSNTEKEALTALDTFSDKWDKKYPVISQMWKRRWCEICTMYAFPDEIRKAIYTTNAIEAVNRQIRKIIKHKGVFPNEQSVMKILP